MTRKEFNNKIKSEYKNIYQSSLHSSDKEFREDVNRRLYNTYKEYYNSKINKALSDKQKQEAEDNLRKFTNGKSIDLANNIIAKRDEIFQNTDPDSILSEYEEKFKSIWVKQNRDYVNTETHQISQKTTRVKEFEGYIENEDMLMYVAVMDERTRQTHEDLDGTILPASDSFWATHQPGVWEFGCRCIAVKVNNKNQVRKDVNVEGDDSLDSNPHNPTIFTDKHTYMKEVDKWA